MKRMHRNLITLSLVFCFLYAPVSQMLIPVIPVSFNINQSYGRGSMWDDPCTIDGFMVGLGAATQSWATFFVGLANAYYTHHCDFWPFA